MVQNLRFINSFRTIRWVCKNINFHFVIQEIFFHLWRKEMKKFTPSIRGPRATNLKISVYRQRKFCDSLIRNSRSERKVWTLDTSNHSQDYSLPLKITNGRHCYTTLILNHALWLGLFVFLIIFSPSIFTHFSADKKGTPISTLLSKFMSQRSTHKVSLAFLIFRWKMSK